MNTIIKAAAIIIKDKKLLVEKSYGKEFYIAPGGKPEANETMPQALIRELSEELGIDVLEEDLDLFATHEADAANHPGQMVIMTTYVVTKYSGEIKPSHEVESLAWVDTNDLKSTPIGSIFAHDIMPKLKEMGKIR